MKFVKSALRSPSSIYFFLLAVAALTSLYFWGKSAHILWGNFCLRAEAPALVVQWEIVEEKSNRFLLSAHYRFEVNHQEYHGATCFPRPFYLNQDSAVSALKEKARQPTWKAWYQPSDPTKSSLEKSFPNNLLFRAAVSSIVLVYFIFLRRRFVGWTSRQV